MEGTTVGNVISLRSIYFCYVYFCSIGVGCTVVLHWCGSSGLLFLSFFLSPSVSLSLVGSLLWCTRCGGRVRVIYLGGIEYNITRVQMEASAHIGDPGFHSTIYFFF